RHQSLMLSCCSPYIASSGGEQFAYQLAQSTKIGLAATARQGFALIWCVGGWQLPFYELKIS
ncbi:hypothetical protein NL514_27615, partial [Klebsiella pneumoniae]|nr:hypothetical protein [Klebsiella pneumoniae]